LTIDLTRRRMPEAAWIACLVVLAMPAYNGYRAFIIREFGYWFFVMLSFWLAQRWEEKGHRWKESLLCQLALGGAILFRLEAAVFYPALAAWQLFAAPAGSRLKRALMISCLPVVTIFLLAAVMLAGMVRLPNRVVSYLEVANVFQRPAGFRQAVEGLIDHLPKFSKDEANTILLVGLLALVPIKLVKMLGVFVAPLAYGFIVQPLRVVIGRWPLLSWALLAHLLTLAAFTIYQLFISARYVSTLNLLAVPLTTACIVALMSRFPRLMKVMLVIVLVTMVANVASFSADKTYIKDAGSWLAKNAKNPDRVYMGDYRVAYYAGWIYRHHDTPQFDGKAVGHSLRSGQIDLAVLHESSRDSSISAWIEANHFLVRERFAGRRDSKVLIVSLPEGTQ
jgi:4-amino-4-deoxy-L-arabinose transferase-like glycosyltransferase